jgi:hypothetical protein
MQEENHAGFRVEHVSILSNFNQNRNASIRYGKTS